MLIKDTKMEELINKLIPNIDDFHVFQDFDAKRNIKSSGAKKRIRELKRLKAKQVAKGEKLQKEKMKDKEKKEKRRFMKAYVKQQEEDEKQERNRNRRRNRSFDLPFSHSK